MPNAECLNGIQRTKRKRQGKMKAEESENERISNNKKTHGANLYIKNAADNKNHK